MRHPLLDPIGDAKSALPTEARPEGPGAPEPSRRSFLGRGIAAAAIPATIAAGSGLARAASSNGPFPSYYQGSTKSKFQEIQKDEYDHVVIITGLIATLGGTPRPLPTFRGIQNLTASQFLAMSGAFENTGVHAYLGAGAYIQNPVVLQSALEIALVEAYHSGFINTLANYPLVPGGIPLTTPYTLAQVQAAVSPYIVSLNDNGLFPASFGTTPSATNDLAILNFALLLEMLEAEFYYYNVPALFP